MIVADCMESGFGIVQTTHMVNEYRAKELKIHVGASAVYAAHLRMKPTVTAIKDVQQGSDNDIVWGLARLNQVSQMLVRMGEISGKEATEFVWGIGIRDDAMLPDYFNPAKLTPINIYALAFWDEVHIEPVVGGRGQCAANARTQVRYQRDEDGLPNQNGTLRPRLFQKKFKYKPHQNRFMLGVAMVKEDDEEVGLRLPLYDYSGKNIISITKYADEQKREMDRVRALPSDGIWVTGKRQAGELFKLDTVEQVKTIGTVAAGKLNVAGILTVQQLMDTPAGESIDGISSATLAKWIGNCSHAKAGAFPQSRVKNHKLAANPYLSLYGRALWEAKIAATTALSGFACITELCTHIITKSAVPFVGTPFEFTWQFSHDALSLLASVECRDWMSKQIIKGQRRDQDRSYLDCWVRPQAGLNEGTIYEHRPVGNSPELMPLDASLNKDLHDDVNRHVAATAHLPKDHDLKFSRANPKEQGKAYKRVYNGSPPGTRIVEDVKRSVKSAETIRQKRGFWSSGMGLARGSGHRAINRTGGHGGLRTKKDAPAAGQWWYPGVKEVRAGIIEAADERVKKKARHA